MTAGSVKRIYQVFGQCGDHEEYENNLLGTYSDKALAEEHVRLAIERKKELAVRYSGPNGWMWRHTEWINSDDRNADDFKPFRGRSIYDPHLANEYGIKTDMTYYARPEKVRETVPGRRSK